MNRLSKKHFSTFLLTFVMVLFVFALQANAADYSSIFRASAKSLNEEHDIGPNDEWTIHLQNDLTNPATFGFVVLNPIASGSLSRMPSFELATDEEIKLYSLTDINSVVLAAGEKAVLKIYYPSYPTGSGFYYIVPVIGAEEILPADKTIVGSKDPSCKHLTKDDAGREYPNFWNGVCNKCGGTCTHPEDQVKYVYFNAGKAGTHYKQAYCDRCGYGAKSYYNGQATWEEKSGTEKCTFGHYDANGNGASHLEICKYCGRDMNNGTVPCITNKSTFQKYAKEKDFLQKGKIHHNIYKCPCGNKIDIPTKHKFKNDKCKYCGYRRVKPGKITNVQVIPSSMTKSSYRVKGNYNHIWVDKVNTCYNGTITISYVKGKNVSKVDVHITGYDSNFGSNDVNNGLTKKTALTCKFTSRSPGWKYTIALTPYSKTGTKGKTVKKTVIM